jgi:hypothetical protein
MRYTISGEVFKEKKRDIDHRRIFEKLNFYRDIICGRPLTIESAFVR